MATTVNGVPFRQWLVPSSKYNIKAPYTMVPKKITLHNTDNQMPAHNEISYMRSNNNQVSYHVAIDEKEAIQGIPYNRNAWAAGDGLNGYGNRNTIHIEICRNYDRARGTTRLNEPLQSMYTQAEQNTIKFTAQLCIDLGIVANNANIKTHNDWSGKWCPSKILNEGRLQLVKNAIIVEYNRLMGIKDNKAEPVIVPSKTGKEDEGLSFKQVVDKAIAGGYKNMPARKENINNKTNFTYEAVQAEIDNRMKGNKAKVTPQTSTPTKATTQKVNLPASASRWRIYNPGGPYTTNRAIGTISPAQFGGLTYDVVGNPVKDVVLINTRDFGTVAIYVAKSTGATITGTTTTTPKPAPKPQAPKPAPKPTPKKVKTKKLHLPATAKTWRVYKPNGPYTVGNEIHLLTPSAFGGITYDILQEKGGHVYIINTSVKGKVAIYAGPETGAKIT